MPFELTLEYFTPILTFLLVFTLVYAVLSKTKLLGDNSTINAFLSFLVALIFIIAPAARSYTLAFTPWIIVFLISLFFFFLIIGFVHGKIDEFIKNKFLAAAVVIILVAIFLISGIRVFSPLFNNYFSSLSGLKDILRCPSIITIFLLFSIGAILSWWFTKK